MDRSRITLQASIDFAAAKTCDSHRRAESWARAVAGIRIAHDERFRVKLATTLPADQIHFELHSGDFFVDLRFFHIDQLRYVVIELKTTKLEPRDTGQLGFYLALVEDRLRRS